MNMEVNEIKDGLKRFGGTNFFYQIPLINTQYTDGIKYLGDKAKCLWLITDASVMAKNLMNRSSFITIDYKKLSDEMQDTLGYDSVIEYSDGNDNILESHKYHTTDFPLETIRLFFINNTLMLPSEY